MTKYKDDGEMYLSLYPSLNKWINECMICHSKGYKPDMPEHISGEYSVAGKHIRKYFRPLAIDDLGVCEQCAKYAHHSK